MKNSLLCLAVLTACSGADTTTPEAYCTDSIEPGLMVYIVDAVTGTPQADGARAFAVDGSYSDSLKFGIAAGPTLVALQGAAERPGLYHLRIDKQGYRTWTQAGVRVFADTCHVLTVRVTARLQPL